MAILRPMARADVINADEIEQTARNIPGAVIITDRADGGVKKGGAPRLSRKMRTAITLRVHKGMSVVEACRAAGVTQSGWFRAMEKPHVQMILQQEKEKYIQQIDLFKSRHKARAIEIAAELMETATSEAVRMRAVEFFAGEAKNGPSITINNAVNSGGYEYVGRGQRIVEIDGDAQDVTDSDG